MLSEGRSEDIDALIVRFDSIYLPRQFTLGSNSIGGEPGGTSTLGRGGGKTAPTQSGMESSGTPTLGSTKKQFYRTI